MVQRVSVAEKRKLIDMNEEIFYYTFWIAGEFAAIFAVVGQQVRIVFT